MVPGGTLLGYLNADHWAVVVPFARTHSTIASVLVTHNAYPREALEAILRFVEEDLGFRGSQRNMYGKRPGGSRRLGTNSVDPLQSIDFVETLLTVFDPKPQSAGEKTGRGKNLFTETFNVNCLENYVISSTIGVGEDPRFPRRF